ncbi:MULTISPECIES: PTS sugar transporter subunit IIA [Aerococcus]|uniref:PTS sugar transporter subunit IIA n=1 Tax=Aerococcus urinae (strain CCUG 59500 / ACS-120-V-Col10a) TaxID=2976812 RepID=UPI000200E70F|nr:PTS sugar transporter subunit IIA [Aerococcus sp. Group 1]AEA01591.1 phosphoenolpyruvate-dependent sugar phosphotransferase system, EIIA 2 [Aerococcus sp. Group 1]MCY3030608.1 PTS sugar transporter subunit IIA [Aerococcus sp. Group 1]MCY3054720.1 PTS sugar transporter subunit IIA [Aerococcus sp. Group 1]MCY3056450.1 PTS sugar transporter subunit IIA [Aerococcus sp. Group 1]MCY3061291.1 PTS sugar transporter subunit IIA [Aerococcus sp. Group 1]
MTDFIQPNRMALQIDLDNPEAAIQFGGNLLEVDGLITPAYTQAMLDRYRDQGPYFVIAPGIAFPHARPEEGALATGFSLVTFKQPIVFSHPTNDPVHLMLCLSATDSQKHLEALMQLAELLQSEALKQKWFQSSDKATILADLNDLGGYDL